MEFNDGGGNFSCRDENRHNILPTTNLIETNHNLAYKFAITATQWFKILVLVILFENILQISTTYCEQVKLLSIQNFPALDFLVPIWKEWEFQKSS